ncbi:MAG: amidohydrolase family protein [Deltaproteobacteria bacterium]|nr:amidohydrolase family protein [Deltaproteobacteria bacterium]
MKIFSKRVILEDASGQLIVAPACISVDGTFITDVEKVDEPPSGVDVLDFGDRPISPAFVNCHTHLPMSAFRGIGGVAALAGNVVEDLFFRIESSLQVGDIRAFTRMGAYEALLSGTGTVWEHYYAGLELADGIEDVGLNAVIAPTLQDLSGPGTQSLESQLSETLEIQSRYSIESGIAAALGPHATDTVSDELWNQIIELANTKNLPIHSHVAQSLEEYQRSVERFSMSPVERLERLGVLDAKSGSLLVHCLFFSNEDLKRIRPQLNTLGFCSFSQMQYAFPAHLPSWIEHDVRYVLGTDCGACNDTMNIQQELRAAGGALSFTVTQSEAHRRFRQSGSLQDAEAVMEERTATRNLAAEAISYPGLLKSVWGTASNMHPDLPVGKIQNGYRANIVVWDPEHPSLWPCLDVLQTLSMADASKGIYQMMTSGQWRGTAGHYSESIVESDDYKEARTEASLRLDGLLKRLNLR